MKFLFYIKLFIVAYLGTYNQRYLTLQSYEQTAVPLTKIEIKYLYRIIKKLKVNPLVSYRELDLNSVYYIRQQNKYFLFEPYNYLETKKGHYTNPDIYLFFETIR